MRAAPRREVPGTCESDTNRAVGRGKRDSQHSTRSKITAARPSSRRPQPHPRDARRLALLQAMQPDRVLDFADYVRRVRARLDADLLDENPDQTAGARAWGLR